MSIMKKRIIALIIVLVLAAAAVVYFTAVKKQDKAPAMETVAFEAVNNTGKNVTEITLDDRRTDNKISAKPVGGGWEDGSSISFTMLAAIEDNAPDLQFSYTVEGGSLYGGTVSRKDGTITLTNGADGLGFDIDIPKK